MKNKIPSIAVLRTVMAALFLALFVGAGFSQSVDAPHKISYQGLLTDGSGKPISNGTHQLAITLYSDAGGTSQVWTSTFTTTTNNGIFNVILGDSGAVLPTPLTMPLWLGVSVDNNAELRPLTQVVSAPYALGIADSTVSTSKLQVGAVTADKMADNYVNQVTLNRGVFYTKKGKSIDITVGRNLNLTVDSDAAGNMSAIIDAIGGGTLNSVTAAQNGGLYAIANSTDVEIGIASEGIQTGMYADGSVTNPKLATGSVDSRVILDGSIQGIDIAPNTITGSNIADYTITGQNIAIPLIMTRKNPGDVLDISNITDLAGTSPVANFSGLSTDGTPIVSVYGKVQNGGGALAVTDTFGTAIQANSKSGFNALDITGGAVRASAPVAADQFASTYTFAAQSANSIQTITSNVVTPTSTVMISYETAPSNFQDVEVVQGSVSNGSFQVQSSGPYFNAGDRIHYIVINH
ncbi:MAG TPA: hypothetical protein VFA55_04890 [Candidatus Kapabacteria bacterium]|nr:hypothetical protein [Candidatus Kapabacteria bacterium]